MSLHKIIHEQSELLSPAGDLERLEMALEYGADAVYLAGERFGMRSSAVSFSREEMKKAVELCHSRGKKLYLTLNTLPREDELALLPDYLSYAASLPVDAFIIADLGIMALAKRYAPNVPLHVSTQLGVTNSATACMLYDMGASRVVLARELPLDEIKKIRSNTPADLGIEAFVHGSMCVSFSGRCLLSNYLTGRDANRGECAQPCRWKYQLMEETRPGQYFPVFEDGGTFIMNSNDMRMIEHIPELLDAGVTSFKVEGRMKSAYYAAIVSKAYRQAIDAALEGRPLDPKWVEETETVSHRPYSTGFYFGEPGQSYGKESYSSLAKIVAMVEGDGPEGYAHLTQRNKFCLGDELELVCPQGDPVCFKLEEMFNAEMQPIDAAPHPMMDLYIKLPVKAPRLSILRHARAKR